MPPPSIAVVHQDDQDLILPPDRVAEPFSLEVWYAVIRGNNGVGIITRESQTFSGSTGYSREDVYTPIGGASQGFRIATGSSTNDPSRVCVHLPVVDCPVRWYAPACSPREQAVDPRDVCLQTTIWPIQGEGFPARLKVGTDARVTNTFERDRSREHNSNGTTPQCPVKTISRSSIDRLLPNTGASASEYTAADITVRVAAVCTSLTYVPT